MLALHDPDGLSALLDPQHLQALRAARCLHELVQQGVEVAEVVIQDEFTHDVVVALGEALFAVYDTT